MCLFVIVISVYLFSFISFYFQVVFFCVLTLSVFYREIQSDKHKNNNEINQ